LYRVLDPGAAVGAVPVSAFGPLALLVVHEHDGQVAVLAGVQPRERIGALTSARQLHAQEGAVTLEGAALAFVGGIGRPDGLDGRSVDGAPESRRGGMGIAPCLLPLLDLDLGRGVVITRELLPSADTGHEAEREIRGLADRSCLLVADSEHSADDEIGL